MVNRDWIPAVVEDQAQGTEFEQDVVASVQKGIKMIHLEKAYPVKTCFGSDLDKKEGTDFMIGEIRFDATSAFSEKLKKFTPYIYHTGIDLGNNNELLMGIRHGNTHDGYTEFPEPVVVIGVDCEPKEYYIWQDAFQECIAKHTQSIIYMADDCLADYLEIDQQEREDCGITRMLEKNPLYVEPRGIGEMYKEINDFREELDEMCI